jgi:iron complex transport system permease protein
MQLDEQEASQMGLNVQRTKTLLLVAASLATAAAVSVVGIVGFVGLLAPHIVRLIIGPDYRRLLPVVTVTGAALLILADLGARTLVSPGELPVGIVTSFVGAPFFLFLLRRQKRVFF